MDLRFQDGLCVLRAPNTSGKSTALQAILYALGLEGMLRASHEVPLPQAVTDLLVHGPLEHPVIESGVTLEVSNGSGEYMTVMRSIKGEHDTRLVRMARGPALTQPTAQVRFEDFFVRAPSAAVSASGFHSHLVKFIGWDLPVVPRYDGGEGLLYMECLFPLLFVEQKKGWSVIPAHFPQYFGIRDVGRRAIEFLLDLDAYRISSQRQALRDEKARIAATWRGLRQEAASLADSVNSVATGIPNDPTSIWPPLIQPSMQVTSGQEWRSFASVLSAQRERLEELDVQSLPAMEGIIQETEADLRQAQDGLAREEFALQRSFDELQSEERQSGSIAQRLTAMRDDLRQYQDAKRLQSFGSEQGLAIAEGHCPTCSQAIVDSLLPQESIQRVMTVEENIEFIKAQIDVFQAMARENEKIVTAKRAEVKARRNQVSESREQVRALRTSLVSDARLPSLAAMQERVTLENRIKQGERVRENFENLMLRIDETAASWRDIEAKLAGLPKGDLTIRDEAKLSDVETHFREQLRLYRLTSTSPDSLSISRETYRPIHEGFDIEFNNSASDMIRTMWAFHTALLETSNNFETNHPGLLVLDEPRQQSAAAQDFGSFLERLSQPGLLGKQVIVATSEEDSTLKALLEGQSYQYITFDQKMLQKLDD